MWHLMKNEIARFRGLAVALGCVHLAILGSLAVSGDLFSAGEASIVVNGMTYCLSGLLFGLYQIGSYRHRHLWIHLLHRPLPPAKIFFALSGAATTLFLAVFVLPLTLVTLVADLSTWQWVDARHYLLAPFVLGTLWVFYLIGCYIMLSPSRAACLVLVLPLFFLTDEAIGRWIFLPLLLVVGWLGYLTYASFKHDLSAHLERPLALTLAALPVQYVFFWLLHFFFLALYSFVIAFAEEGWKSFARHSWDDYFGAGTYAHVEYLPADRAMAHGLRQAGSEHAEAWLTRLAGIRVNDLLPRRAGVGLTKPQSRGQLLFMDRSAFWYDKNNAIQWTFSHDTMRILGRDRLSRAPIGWLGTTGPIADSWNEAPAFAQVPVVDDEGRAHTRHQIYVFDSQRQEFDLHFEVASDTATSDERFLDTWTELESFSAVVSDRALYIFENTSENKGSTTLVRPALARPTLARPTLTVPWQGTVHNLSRLLVARLDDGYLVSQIDGKRSEREHGLARQTVTWFSDSGGLERLADQHLAQGPPAWMRHRGFLVSPVLQYLHDLIWSALEPYNDQHCGLENVFKLPSSRSVLIGAFLLALISSLLTAWVARRRGLNTIARRAWTAAGFLIGPPAFFSFLVLTPANNH